MDPAELEARFDRLVAEYADRVASGEGQGSAAMDDLLAQVPPERRVELRRLLELVEIGGSGEGVPRHAPKPLGPGVELGGCRILGQLGRGGVATVYRAEQKALRREVALKVLRPGLALDPKHAERFRREGLAIAQLEHPNVVRVHDVGTQDGHLYLVMEKADGGNLAQALAGLPDAQRREGVDFRRAIGLPSGEAVADGGDDHRAGDGAGSFEVEVARFFAIVARGVAAAHARGIVHRDLKPSNILLKRGGVPVVADFGLAKGEGDLGFTLTGEPLGTPYYMSPEQVEQAQTKVDARTDVWSLGVTLYEVLAGKRPFEGPTTIAVFDAIRRDPPPPLRSRNPRLSKAAEQVVAKAMARAPDDRYASAEMLAADLDALATGRPVSAPRGDRFGGFLQRWHRSVSNRPTGKPFEYRSRMQLFGLPLVHINVAGNSGLSTMRTAKGIIAIGDAAVGVIAVGGVAMGGFAFGGCTIGVVSFAGLAAGLVALGGVAVGGIAIGGCAIGVVAFGGLAIGWWASGGKALGYAIVDAGGASAAMYEFYESRLRPWLDVRGSGKVIEWLDRKIFRK